MIHEDPHIGDWEATVIKENSVSIKISDELVTEGAHINLKDSTRCLIMRIEIPNHEFEIETFTGDPMFIELVSSKGISVRYVEGSGKNYYHN